MSLEPTPAAIAEYDQAHASTVAYLEAMIQALRGLVQEGIPRPLAVVALAEQLEDPDPDTGAFAKLDHSDISQLLAVAVDRLEPGWPA